MKTLLKSAALVCLSLLVFSCSTEKKIELFNGQNLDNWNIIVDSEDGEPKDLFYVEDGVLNTLGDPFGYIRTKESYSNYTLHLEWRWTNEPSNSGVLLNVQGKERIFPQCVECQLMHGKAGDIVLMGKGTAITIKDSTYTVASEKSRYLAIAKFEESSEKPAGEWNSYDITSKDGSLEVFVNGVLQNSASGMSLTEGNIALQSEGAPLQFRNIFLQAL
jgi:hypothetical protein